MFYQSFLAIVLVLFLIGCNNPDTGQTKPESKISEAASGTAEVIKENLKSIEENYEQQADDTLPPETQVDDEEAKKDAEN